MEVRRDEKKAFGLCYLTDDDSVAFIRLQIFLGRQLSNSIPEFTGFLLNGVVVDETEPIIFTAGRDNYLEIKAHDSDNDRIEIEINNIEGHLDADKHFVFNKNNNTGILSWAPTSDRIGEELSITFKVTDYPGEVYDVNYTSSNLVSIVIRVE